MKLQSVDQSKQDRITSMSFREIFLSYLQNAGASKMK